LAAIRGLGLGKLFQRHSFAWILCFVFLNLLFGIFYCNKMRIRRRKVKRTARMILAIDKTKERGYIFAHQIPA